MQGDGGTDYRWDDVKVFLAAHRERTLAGAAARLGVDASTVSRRLTAFEEAVGAALFDRTREGLVPTAAADQILPVAEEIGAAALRLTRAAEQLEAEPEGVVRLTCVPGLSDAFVVPQLARLHARYPRLRLDLDASTAVADLSRGEADLAIRLVRPAGGDLVVTRLMQLPHAVLAAPDYAASLGTLTDPGKARWIDWSRERSHLPAARWLAEHAPGVEPVVRVSSMAALLAAAASGLGAAVLPRPYMTVLGLSRVPLGGALAAAEQALPNEDVWLVGHRALRDVPRVAAVWQFLLEAVKRTEMGQGGTIPPR